MSVEIIIKDEVWQELKTRLDQMASEMHVQVGVIGTGETDPKTGINMATLAAIHELGAPPNIPERSFIRRTFEDKQEELGTICGKLAHAIVEKGMTPEKAYNLIGTWGAAECKKTITEGNKLAPNAESTIKRKGSSRPLVDTGQLVQSITWAVMSK